MKSLLFVQQILSEHLLSARHCLRCWEDNSEENYEKPLLSWCLNANEGGYT